MNKSLTALAILGIFSGSAAATDVTLYGVIDQGFSYNHSSSKVNGSEINSFNGFSMESGLQAGSRVGLKGTEDLGNDLTVGFVLENGFAADTGALGNGSRLFGREANLFIRGAFGELSFGRVGNLQSGYGSYGLAGEFSPFGTSYGDVVAQGENVFMEMFRLDNAVTYKSPTFAGVTAYAQYSFKVDATWAGEEGKSSADRYCAVGVTYENGALKLAGVVDSINYASDFALVFGDSSDSLSVTAGGSYDFEVVKFYAGAQYFDDYFGSKGYALITGLAIPVWGGTAKVGVAYQKNESTWDDRKYSKTFSGSVGYEYPLSQRTNVYAVAAYGTDKGNQPVPLGYATLKQTAIKAAFGVNHKF